MHTKLKLLLLNRLQRDYILRENKHLVEHTTELIKILKTSWVYNLRKENLITYLPKFNQKTTGSMEKLRRRLAHFIPTEHKAEEIGRLLELQTKYKPPKSPNTASGAIKNLNTKSMPTLRLVVPEETLLSIDEKRSIMETMRKWNIKYDSTQDPFMFIERIKKGADSYRNKSSRLTEYYAQSI
uniref:Uncharacterized protein n=1 Tax=Glossina austeni TaxID=7395 RepID=A0A1A9V4M0_GLOAU